jgi:hypothetical protein
MEWFVVNAETFFFEIQKGRERLRLLIESMKLKPSYILKKTVHLMLRLHWAGTFQFRQR